METDYQNFERRVRRIFRRKTGLALTAFFRPGHFMRHFSTRYAPQLALYEAVGNLSEAEQDRILSAVPAGTKLPDFFSVLSHRA